MKRREFISLLGGAALTWPLAVRAQQVERLRRIGVLTALSESDPEVKAWLTALEEGLQSLGWVQGRNLRIDYRWPGGDEYRLQTYAAELVRTAPDVLQGRNLRIDYRWPGGDEYRLQTYAAELVRTAPDVLFCSGVPALMALHQQTRSLPIVFTQVSDPVRLGFVGNLARPGGNVTGFTTFEHAIGGKWLELIKDTVPGVAVIFDPDNPLQPLYLQAIEAAAPSFGVELILAGVRNAADIERAIDTFAHSKGALIVLPSFVTLTHRDLIFALAARHGLPAIYSYRVFTNEGGFMSYGVDLADLYRRAASYVDLILKGAKPGDLPVQLATKFELVVNLKAAKALGLTIPEPFLQRADEVIE
jgi:putative ABC transport system substrate-binding protein